METQPTGANTDAALQPACGPMRWLAKKAARKGLAVGAWACSGLSLEHNRGCGRGQGTKPRVRVLTYHRCGARARDPFCVSAEMFEAQMRLLSQQRRAVSLADLEAFLAGDKSLPEGAVLVTVDDGCRSVLTEMLPVWRRCGVPAVVYVNPGLIGAHESQPAHALATRPEQGPQDLSGQTAPAAACVRTDAAASEPLMTWDELGTLVEAGLTIGSHGLTHRSLGRMSEQEAREEAVCSRELIERRLGVEVRSFAYPFGTRADFSPATRRVLAEAGYTTAMTSQHGAITPDEAALELPRIKVEGGEGLWMFRLLCCGALDAWRVVDRNLWRLQAAGR